MVELTSVQFKVMEFIFNHMDSTGTPPTIREIASHFQWKSIGSAQDVIAALRKKGLLLCNVPGKSRQIVPTKEVSEFFIQYLANPNFISNKKNNYCFIKKPFIQKSFAQQVLPGFEDFMRVPLVGKISAGIPHEAIETTGDFVTFPNVAINKKAKFFALEIDGLSMIQAGLLPNDLVLVEVNSSPKENDIVVASLSYSETTIKRYAKKGSQNYEKNMQLLNTHETVMKLLPNALLLPENPNYLPIPFGMHEDDKIIGIVRSLYRKNIY